MPLPFEDLFYVCMCVLARGHGWYADVYYVLPLRGKNYMKLLAMVSIIHSHTIKF